MILIATGALVGALLTVVLGMGAAFVVGLVAGLVLIGWCVSEMIAVRDPYKLPGVPTARVIREGWRR